MTNVPQSQLHYLLGTEGVETISQKKILLVGVGAVGVEIARLLCLCGCKFIGIHDCGNIMKADVSGSTILGSHHVNESRASLLERMLMELHKDVHIYIHNEKCATNVKNLDFILKFDCVIVSDVPINICMMMDKVCRKNTPPIPFIMSFARKGGSYVFTDFGPTVSMYPNPNIIHGIVAQFNDGLVSCVNDHGLENGDFVSIDDSKPLQVVKIISPIIFKIQWKSSDGIFTPAAKFVTVPQPKKFHFNSFEKELKNPSSVSFCGNYGTSAYSLFVLMLAFQKFQKEQNQMPKLSNRDAVQTVAIATDHDITWEQKPALDSSIEFELLGPPIPSVVTWTAGTAATEVIKALTKKFTPIQQWSVMAWYIPRNPTDVRVLLDKRIAVIGCSSVACELLPLLVSFGAGTGERGKLLIYDHDVIYPANINSQSLFRLKHVKRGKALVAQRVLQKQHPSLKIEGYFQNCKCVHESVWSKQDIIICTVDNYESRNYMADMCMRYMKPLFITGVDGFAGSLECVIPNVSRSYIEMMSNPNDTREFPYCTLKSFPSSPDHCVLWAMTKFETLFYNKPNHYNTTWKDVDSYEFFTNMLGTGSISLDAETWTSLKLLMSLSPTWDWKSCIHFATAKLQKYFSDKAQQLVSSFPTDTLIADGSAFWKPPKFMPIAVAFNLDDPIQIEFIRSCAQLLASVLRIMIIESQMSIPFIKKTAEAFPRVPFQPRHGKHIETDEKADHQHPNSTLPEPSEVIEQLKSWFKQFQGNKFVKVEKPPLLSPISLTRVLCEDTDTFRFLYAASNLRAQMYGLESLSEADVKRIAGKLVPSTPTASAVTATMVCGELLNYIYGREVGNHFFNLTSTSWIDERQLPVEVKQLTDTVSVSAWDRWEIHGSPRVTIEEFANMVNEQYHVNMNMLLQGTKMVYAPDFNAAHKHRKSSALNTLLDFPDDSQCVVLTLGIETNYMDDADIEVPVPPVFYYHNHKK